MGKSGSTRLIASLIVICVLGCRALLNAQKTEWPKIHAEDDALWARRSNLALEQVRQLRHLAEVPDTSSDMIDNIDTSALSDHGRLVFATYGGTAKCVGFWVFSKANNDFKRIWSSEQAGEEANFCADPKCSVPVVRMRGNQDIEVEIPSYRSGHCAVRSVGLFVGNGNEYTYKGIVARNDSGKSK